MHTEVATSGNLGQLLMEAESCLDLCSWVFFLPMLLKGYKPLEGREGVFLIWIEEAPRNMADAWKSPLCRRGFSASPYPLI